MRHDRTMHCSRSRVLASIAFACASVFLLSAFDATAQDRSRQGPAAAQAEAPPTNFFQRMGRWFDDSFSWMGSGVRTARDKVSGFGHEAGVAAKSTVSIATDAAKGAADAVTTLPKTRVVSGHEVCRLAPNGAPDCVAAAIAVCKSKGFNSGTSVSMTVAEKCPPRVLLSGRTGAPNECSTETFVSRAVCQ